MYGCSGCALHKGASWGGEGCCWNTAWVQFAKLCYLVQSFIYLEDAPSSKVHRCAIGASNSLEFEF